MEATSVESTDITSSYSGFTTQQILNLFKQGEHEKVYSNDSIVQKLNVIYIKHLALSLPMINKCWLQLLC